MDYNEYIDKLQYGVEILKAIEDFEALRDSLSIRIMNPALNRKKLSQLEYVPFLDLAVTFAIKLRDADGSTGISAAGDSRMLIRVTKELTRLWGLSASELLDIALENERRNTSFISDRLIDTLKLFCVSDEAAMRQLEAADRREAAAGEICMYTLYDKSFLNGSVALLLNEVLYNASKKIGGDMLILPSSVNELICIPDSAELDYRWLADVVREINDTAVPEEEILSYSIYKYSSDDDIVSVVA